MQDREDRKQDQRRQDRDSLFLVAQLRLEHDGAPHSVKLRNISDHGVMAEGAVRLTRGSAVWIELCNVGQVQGKIAWVAGDRCGIAFDNAIDSAKVGYPVDEVDLPVEKIPSQATRDQSD